jgi:hypothetical protein
MNYKPAFSIVDKVLKKGEGDKEQGEKNKGQREVCSTNLIPLTFTLCPLTFTLLAFNLIPHKL